MTDLSYQLYSSREFPPLLETLKMLRSLGYAEVEGFGGVYENLDVLAAGLEETGLRMTSGHFSLDAIETDPSAVIKTAKAAGMKAIYCPHIVEAIRPTDRGGWHEFGVRLERAGKPLWDAGFIYGWHNHDFEFKALEDDTIPMEEILAGGPNLSWEADIAWIVRGGGDPLDWIARHGDRMSSVHIKDIAPEGQCLDEDGWEDVGHGTMDWQAIWSAVKKTPTQFFVMEHDKPNDHERFARRSIEAVRAM